MLVSRDDDDTVRARLRMRLILPRDKPLSRFFPFFFVWLPLKIYKQTNKQTEKESVFLRSALRVVSLCIIRFCILLF